MRPLVRVISRSHVRGVLIFAVATAAFAADDTPIAAPEPVIPAPAAGAAPAADPFNTSRIMGVIPDYQTVRDPDTKFVPLTGRQKWALALKENIDPYNVATAAMTAGFSQMGNQTPKYGEGSPAYGMRFGAALADFGTQNVFSAGVLANLLHQDPRYWRKGPGTSVVKRVLYSASRVAITHNDAGAWTFNTSGVLGTCMGIAASNLYYPSVSVRGSVMLGRLNTSFTGGIIGNLMSEFWPDLQQKFFHHKSM